MSTDYDRWKTSEPDECSFCGSSGHTKRFCPAWKAEKAEHEEMRADERREERQYDIRRDDQRDD